MDRKIELRIEGRPIPWKAPEFGRTPRGKRIAFSVPAYDAWKQTCHWQARAQMAGIKPLAVPCELTAEFHLIRKPGPLPDLTNLVKALEDAIQGVAVTNDRLIVAHQTQRLVVPAGGWEGVICSLGAIA